MGCPTHGRAAHECGGSRRVHLSVAITTTRCAPSRSFSPTWAMSSSRRRRGSLPPSTRTADVEQKRRPSSIGGARVARGRPAEGAVAFIGIGDMATAERMLAASHLGAPTATSAGWRLATTGLVPASAATASPAWHRCCKPSPHWRPSGGTASCSTPPPRWRRWWRFISASSISRSLSCSARSPLISAVHRSGGDTILLPGLPWPAATWRRPRRR